VLGLVVWRDGRGLTEKSIPLNWVSFFSSFCSSYTLLYKNNKNRIELMGCPHTSLVADSAAFSPSFHCQ